jgi:flagellar hook-associated protein 1
MMSTGIYSIGISGINAAQLGLLATEHNVVNANTPGYTRQRTVQATNIAVNTGAGAIGQGVHVQTIERLYDKFLTAQVNTASTKLSEIDAYYSQIKQIDNLLADPSAGLSPALQDFFSGVQQVASNPSLLSARQAMISSAQTLVNRFQAIDLRLSEIDNEVNGKITDAVAEVNSYAGQIAELNQRIIIAESSYGQPANDLLDQRDKLISDLNGLIKVTTTINTDGSFNVFIGSGQQLVVGAQAMTMTASASTADNGKIVVGLATALGGVIELPEKLIVGGELGGLVSFRGEVLEKVQNDLGRIAATVALTFNAQHALGQDLLGNVGSAVQGFFSMANTAPSVLPNSNNTGTAAPVVTFLPPSYGPEANSGNFYTNLTTSDYRLTFDGTNYSLLRLSDNAVLSSTGLPGGSITADGISVALPAAGVLASDSFLIQPTKNVAANVGLNAAIAADSRLIAAAAPFRTSADDGNTGSGTISSGTLVGTASAYNSAIPLPVTVEFQAGSPAQLLFSGAGAPTNVLVKYPGQPEIGATTPLDYQSGMSISFSGMSFSVSGAMNDGDTFLLTANTAGTSDGRNALALGSLQTKNTVSGDGTQGRATFQSAYAQLVAENGIKTRELKVTGEAQQAMLDQAQANRDALSGVNLDEEAANMLRYQQAYQASAKLLEVGKTLFDTIIQIG